MKSLLPTRLTLCAAVIFGLCARLLPAAPPVPENLARKAAATATSEHNGQYLARFAIDDKIPPAGSSAADLGAAWCVLKAKSGDTADFTLAWKEPVELSELVYWGRTSWFMNECWKDYELYLNDAAQPAAKGAFKEMHGPQRVKFAKTKVSKATFKFLNSYGGFNPGAAEIQAFAESPTDKQLALYLQKIGASYAAPPRVEGADAEKLRALVGELQKLHGAKYAQAAEHLARLDQLEKALDAAQADAVRRGSPTPPKRPTEGLPSGSGTGPENNPDAQKQVEDLEARLEQLERDVLLWDVDQVAVIRRNEINASHVYTYHYEGFSPGGGLYTVSLKDLDQPPKLLVESPTGQILDLDLSYDGRTILFSWRRKQDEGYHLWTIGVDGSGLKQLTDGVWHDYNPCWLPDGGIAFLSTRNPQFAYCWHAPVGILHRMEADGSNVKRLSANYLNDFTPTVLDDGRIIFTRWEYVDRPAIPIQSLWTINPDGTDLQGYFGNRVLSPGTFMEARSIPGTTKIICTMTGHNGPTRGAIGVVDRSRGLNVQEAIENITPDTPVPAVNQGCGNTDGSKLYSCPMPLDRERFLLSARGPVLVRTIDGACQSMALAAPQNGMQWFSATPVRARTRQPVISRPLRDGEEPLATLFLQDVYNGLEPAVKRGEVTRIRVVREMQKTVRIDPGLRAFGFQFPVISCGATYAGKIVLGEVPVEADGSACFRVPAETPMYFMALDAQGRAVQRMRTFTHFMPGEAQGCIGCHEHKLQTSRGHVGAAQFRQPVALTPPEWGAGGFDYSRVVQPVLDKHCVKCHDPVNPPKRIDLTGGKTDFFNVSYDCLAREGQGGRGSPYVNWIPTYNGQEWNILQIAPKTWGSTQSKLADVVLSGHPDEQGKPKIELSDPERRRILAWIDLNVPYYGTSETSYPNNIGCVQVLPKDLESVLADVARRRCAECHKEAKVPRREWVRITEPRFNPFLVAPLAKSAGGSERCGRAIFKDTSDPDYQAILATFKPVEEMLRQNPRMDMPGARPSSEVSRCCQ